VPIKPDVFENDGISVAARQTITNNIAIAAPQTLKNAERKN